MAITTLGFTAATTRGTSLTTGVAHTKGSYVQLTASSAHDTNAVYVYACDGSAAGTYMIDIATGGAGSETVVLPNLLFDFTNALNTEAIGFVFPLRIVSGTRISARAQSNNSTATCDVIIVIDGNAPAPASGGTSWLALGADTATTNGTVNTAGNANAKGSYTQLTASSGAAAKMAVFKNRFGTTTTTQRLSTDIATGAAASEVILVADIVGYIGATADDVRPDYSGPFVVDVASGTRWAVRSQSDQGTGPSHACIVYTTDFVYPTGGSTAPGGSLIHGLVG